MGRLLKKKDSTKKKKDSNDSGAITKTSEENPESGTDTGAKASSVLKGLGQKKTIPAVKSTVEKGDKNFIEKSIQFLREVKVELKKVTWPSRKQTIGSTVVVIVLVMIISLFLGLIDMSLSGLVRIVFQ